MRKILLNKNRSSSSVNQTNFIPVEISRDKSLFHDDILTETVDITKLYNEEKDKSTKHRFIFTIYPLCSNVLYNKLTEIVYKEGSDDARIITNSNYFNNIQNEKINHLDFIKQTKNGVTYPISEESVNRLQCIRNTEYSNDIFNLNYHCGLDIFNNHLLRSKEDITVQKKGEKKFNCKVINEENKQDKNQLKTDAFNTIGDVNRTFNGDVITLKLPNTTNYTYKTGTSTSFRDTYSPLYLYDTIQSFEESCQNNIKRKDGWVGFTNPSTFHIPIINEYYVNKCINNKKPCEFIDLSPERDLFSFTPKKNKYRQRLEYNWDYCLTYPYKSEYGSDDNIILKGKNKGISFIKKNNENYETYIAANGLEMIRFYSPVKHNIHEGDIVAIKYSYYFNDDGEIKEGSGSIKCPVASIKTNVKKYEGRCFSIYKTDFDLSEDSIKNFIIESSIDKNENVEVNFFKITGFAKVIQGFECEYYYRKFKKLDTNAHSSINRLGFANTIYGDDVTQIVYTDDIDIENYCDNRGRPLSEIFLTVVKKNVGHEEWYDKNICNNKNIEFSHVFGKVTSGLDLAEFVSEPRWPNIRCQHNIDINKLSKLVKNINIRESASTIESDIQLDKQDEFYGDLVEYNPVTLEETILEDVFHRFNTAQREIVGNSLYQTIYYDEIYTDIYDATHKDKTPIIKSLKENDMYANLAPEGYIYRPHHRIRINTFESNIRQGNDTLIQVEIPQLFIKNEEIELTFETNVNYSFLPGSIVTFIDNDYNCYKFRVSKYIYDKTIQKYICNSIFEKLSYQDSNIEKYLATNDNPTPEPLENCYFFQHNMSIPEYAYMLPDTSGRHLWREIQAPSTWFFTDELYTTPFTNGSFYHQTNIIFPLQRQDPFKKFDMTVKYNGEEVNNYEIPSNEYDYSDVEYDTIGDISCF